MTDPTVDRKHIKSTVEWSISTRNHPRKFAKVPFYLVGLPKYADFRGAKHIETWLKTIRGMGFLARSVLMTARPEPTWRIYVRRK